MMEILQANPWMIIVLGAFSIPILGIIFGTITNYLSSVRRAELEAGLKEAMLNRGMSASEIKMVIEATTSRKGKACQGRHFVNPEEMARN